MSQGSDGRQQPVDVTAPKVVGDDLVLRLSTADDVERIATLVSHVFRGKPEDPPNARIATWMRDLGSGRHPLTGVDQGLLVENIRTGEAVASMWIIPTTWSFGGIRFGVGRPEAVASHPDYRRRGLVRALFDAFHTRSAQAGELAQAITGIPYYYRQFGYEMAVELDGGCIVQFDDIPPLKAGESEAYVLRRATSEDLPFVLELYERERRRSLVSADIPLSYWHWTLNGVSAASGECWNILLLCDLQGTPCGFVLPRYVRSGKRLDIKQMLLVEGLSWAAVSGSLLRALRAHAQAVPPEQEAVEPSRLGFDLGTAHPAYVVLNETLAPRRDHPYAWYVRVPDLLGFVRHVAPVLEARLGASPLAGYTGTLHLDFYRSSLRLVFEKGRLTAVEEWQRRAFREKLDVLAGLPPLVFLQLLFGRRSRAELEHVLPDVWANEEAAILLDVLFPPQSSFVMHLD